MTPCTAPTRRPDGRTRRSDVAKALQKRRRYTTAPPRALAAGAGRVMTDVLATVTHRLPQPALKVRGREYVNIIYAPEYDLPENLVRLRRRGLTGKRNSVLREFAMGTEALGRHCAACMSAPLRCWCWKARRSTRVSERRGKAAHKVETSQPAPDAARFSG
jgi:hypothetical protein